MLLLTDGRLMCQDADAVDWWALTPDSQGSYINGTWHQLASMQTPRLYYASTVMKDGRVTVWGGEYTGDTSNKTDSNSGEIYDPVTDSWSLLPTPAGWWAIGDAPAALLPDGRELLGSIKDSASAVWDPVANSWANAGSLLAGSEEASWVLLPTGDVITVDCTRSQESELWSNGVGWVEAGALPVDVVESSSKEIGPALLLPDGRAMFFGATGATLLYAPAAIAGQSGSWTAGPTLPLDATGAQVVAKDAPALLLPNGHVLLIAAAEGASGWGVSSNFYDVDPTVSPIAITLVAAPSNAWQPPYAGRLLLLPTGEAAFSETGFSISILAAPTVVAVPAPAITVAPGQADAGDTFQLTGTGFNGVSQSVAYGDDACMATNYPLVRLVNASTGSVTYARTHDHSTMGVATGSTLVTTQVTLPASLAGGTYQLVVVANGVPSLAVAISIQGGQRPARVVLPA